MTWVMEHVGIMAVKAAIHYLESKYPGFKILIEEVISWLEGQRVRGNDGAAPALLTHFRQFWGK